MYSYSAVGTGVLLDVQASATASMVKSAMKDFQIQRWQSSVPPAQSMRLVVSWARPLEKLQSSTSKTVAGLRTLSERTRSLRHLG